MATPKFLGVLRVPVAEAPLSKFLNPPLIIEQQKQENKVGMIAYKSSTYNPPYILYTY